MVLRFNTNPERGKPKTCFLVFGRVVSQKTLFLLVFSSENVENVGFPVQNHFFPRKKLVFPSKTILFLGKFGSSVQRQFFSWQKVCI